MSALAPGRTGLGTVIAVALLDICIDTDRPDKIARSFSGAPKPHGSNPAATGGLQIQ